MMEMPLFREKHGLRSGLILLTASTLFLALVLEILFRLTVFIVLGPERERVRIVSDPEFGWVLNVLMKPERGINRCREEVFREVPTHPLIVKYPRHPLNPKRILFVGDSFTHAHEVSTGHGYYDVFEELVRAEYAVYAGGVGGYSSFQEYLLIRRVYEEIRPHVIVWQLCANDPFENVFRLDKATFYNMQRARPYFMEDGSARILNPGFILFQYSRGFKFLFERLLLLDWKYDLGMLDAMNRLIRLDPADEKAAIRQGFAILGRLLRAAMVEFPETTFVGFSADGEYEAEYRDIFLQSGAKFIAGICLDVDQVEGTNCKPLDSHWNLKGNRVAGEALYRSLVPLLSEVYGR
jgi:hypothetical protein